MNPARAPFATATAEQTCFVYDVNTGHVVHIHQFCPLEPGGRCAEAEMERTALELAPKGRAPAELAVFHHAGELKLKAGHRYRIDPERRAFLAEPHEPRSRGKRRSGR